MIIRIEKTKDYSIISNYIFKDNTISARAKGIYAYIMTLPDDWKLYKKELISHFSEGINAIDTAFQELEKSGYISKEKSKNESNGLFDGWNYTIYEHPKTDLMENRHSESRPLGNPPLLNTNTPSTKELNTNKKKRDAVFLPFDNDLFKQAWGEWCKYRKEKKSSLTDSTIKKQLEFLKNLGIENAIKSINTSIEKGWAGLFEPTQSRINIQTKAVSGSNTQEFIERLNNKKYTGPDLEIPKGL
jgi:hypothetical protein